MKNIITINKQLDQLQGKQCWGIIAGVPNGSYFHLHFGKKIERKHPINNDHLLYGLGNFTGEYKLGVFCTWRLQKNGKPITSSSESNISNGPLENGLVTLLNQSIDKIEIVDTCGDLNLYLNQFCLKIFCSNTGNESDDYFVQHETNWLLSHMGKAWIEVERGCKLVVNP